MKKTLFIIVATTLAAILTAITGHALAPSILSKINKGYSSRNLQLSCLFNAVPQYTVNSKEKRIDLTLKNTLAADNLVLPETDDKIVKILSLAHENATTISLFFRYPPQKVTVIPGSKNNELLLNVILGNEFSATLSDFSSQQQDSSAAQQKSKDSSNPAQTCPYSGNWKNFFKEYEADLKIEPAVQFSFVPFPAITLLQPDRENNIAIMPSAILEGAKQNHWKSLITLIAEEINHATDPENKKKLILTYGDILLRAGNSEEAYKQFYLLSTQYATEPVGTLAKYLLLRLQAEYSDPYLADVELKNLESTLSKKDPIIPYLFITQVEIALATKEFKQMCTLLEKDDISLPAPITSMKALRQADCWRTTGELIKAQASYQLLDKSGVLAENGTAFNGYCSILYRHKQFKQAYDCYDRLARQPSTNTQPHLDMISFRKTMAKLHFTPETKMLNDFAEIELTFPATEAGIRAAIKETDIKLLTMKNWEKTALAHYQTLAETAPILSIREEAAFKTALVYKMLGQKAKSVELLMEFIKEFQHGALHNTALALLIETMPDLLKENIKNGKYIEALVLAKQSKFLFVKNWISINLLADMAEAYRQLGFFNEASKTYLYLLEISTKENRGPYYLPLIKLAYEQGDSETVEGYASQYAAAYPAGPDQEEILYIRLQNLMSHNQYKEALALLSGKTSKDPRFKMIQASLSFFLNDYAKAKTILEELKITADTKQTDALFMLAESAYQLGDNKQAEELFTPLRQDAEHKDQALFRLAEIARHNGQKESALKLFTEVVEKGKNPLWQRLAKKELELTGLKK
jgi:outer membrane protein assembly factor BamD (BamD/ComL family)